MSKNIDQIYIANPITTNDDTDLMYFGRAPYNSSADDKGMLYSDFVTPIQKSGFNTGADTGVADAYVIALDPPIMAYTEGLIIYFVPANSNTIASPTIDAGAGPIQVQLLNEGTLLPSDIFATVTAYFIYLDGAWSLLNPIKSYVSAYQAQNSAFTIGADVGTTNAYVWQITDPSYAVNYTLPGSGGQLFQLTGVANTNTGASTLAVSAGNNTHPIITPNGSALVGGEMVATHAYLFMYNNNNSSYVLLNSSLTPSSSGPTDYQVQSGYWTIGTDSGTANSYTVTLPNNGGLAVGQTVNFIPANSNTGPSDLSINGGPSHSIFLPNGDSIAAGDIASGTLASCICVYDLFSIVINYQLLNPQVSMVSALGIQTARYTSGTDTGAADAYVIALAPAITSYVNGLTVAFTPANNNLTTTPTLDAGGGAIGIVLSNGAVVAGDLSTTSIAECIYSAAANKFILNTPATVDGIVNQAWTPTITFATPGDLNVSYSAHSGNYSVVGNVVTCTFTLECTPTYTTASGYFYIAGLPFPNNAAFYNNSFGIITFGTNVTYPVGTSSLYCYTSGNFSYLVVEAQGSGVGATQLTTTQIPSGVALAIIGSITYQM